MMLLDCILGSVVDEAVTLEVIPKKPNDKAHNLTHSKPINSFSASTPSSPSAGLLIKINPFHTRWLTDWLQVMEPWPPLLGTIHWLGSERDKYGNSFYSCLNDFFTFPPPLINDEWEDDLFIYLHLLLRSIADIPRHNDLSCTRTKKAMKYSLFTVYRNWFGAQEFFSVDCWPKTMRS